jgi:hypothetical protein
VELYVDKGPVVLVGNDKNRAEAIKVLVSLLKQAELEDKELERVDIRYDKVIVLFEE